MSGGSFGYLCFSDSEDEARGKGDDLRRMAEVLEEEAPDHPVTAYTRRLAASEDSGIPGQVSEVWMKVEWWRSGDIGHDAVKLALERTSDWKEGTDG